MNIEFDNNIPIYIQLLDYLKVYIISGQIKTGDKLPSVRELAFTFKVNPNTMQKALLELENMGLIYTERTNGKFVTDNVKIIDQVKKEYAKTVINDYFNKMLELGINKQEAIKLLEKESDK